MCLLVLRASSYDPLRVAQIVGTLLGLPILVILFGGLIICSLLGEPPTIDNIIGAPIIVYYLGATPIGPIIMGNPFLVSLLVGQT